MADEPAIVTQASPAAHGGFPGIDQLPVIEELPNPLQMLGGETITSLDDWQSKRKPELKKLFQHYMYGPLPPRVEIKAEVRRVDRDAIDGKATLKQIAITCGPAGSPTIHLLLIVPNAGAAKDSAAKAGDATDSAAKDTAAKAKRPGVILGLNFTGNHALLDDPRIALAQGWVGKGPGVVDERATDAARGTGKGQWQAEMVVDRGYALATFYYGDVMPDNPKEAAAAIDFFRGLVAGSIPPGERPTSERSTGTAASAAASAGAATSPATATVESSTPAVEGPGAIMAWAWGLQRAVDYLLTDADLDQQDITVYGHSRNGKAALLAGAFDERIRAIIPHQAGCGGSAPSRCHNPKAETIARINRAFPHWFNSEFKQFVGHEDQLPLDQNCLVAVCFPRAVFFTAGEQDQWANPPGQLEVLKSADKVYGQFGVDGIDEKAEAEFDKRIGARLCYLLRDAAHTIDAEYWKAFLDFADDSRQPAPAH